MLYLLDANILITANASYYPIERVPEFWDWLRHQANSGYVKIPLEIMDEIKAGRDDDPLIAWVSEAEDELHLDEDADEGLVRRVIEQGYAPDLTDIEVEGLGRDPFLIAYGLVNGGERCVVTTEVSKPSRQRQNRKIPDVCNGLAVGCCGPFELNRALGFSTTWRR